MPAFNWPIIGHEKIISYLQNAIAGRRLGHGYLFYGPKGVGKKLTADYFIKSIYCEAAEVRPCHKCAHCHQIDRHIHPDIIYLNREEEKKNISVEQVRAARSRLQRGTFLNSHKIILIDEADSLSLGGANAFLKILEEPLGQTIFIFIAERLKNIPATVLSRLQVIKFLPVPTATTEKYLAREKYSRAESYELAHLAAGLPGQILPFLKHRKILDDHKENFRQILTHLTGDLNSRLSFVGDLSGQAKSISAKLDCYRLLDSLIQILRDALLVKNICFDRIIHTYQRQQLMNFAAHYSLLELASLLNQTKQTRGYLDMNVNPRLALENLMLQFN